MHKFALKSHANNNTSIEHQLNQIIAIFKNTHILKLAIMFYLKYIYTHINICLTLLIFLIINKKDIIKHFHNRKLSDEHVTFIVLLNEINNLKC